MKRSAVIFLSAALLCGLCGCAANNAETEQTVSGQVLSVTEASESVETTISAETEAVTEPETSAPEETEETAGTEPEFLPGEGIIISFLSYLQNGGDSWGADVTYTNLFGYYDFMDDFRIDSYSYKHREDGIYDITLTCSESSCEMFPDGDSYWYADTNWHGNFIFYPAEKENKIIFHTDMFEESDETLKTAFWAAEAFSLWTYVYEADETWFDTYEHTNPHDFYHAYNPYMEADELGGVTVEEHIRATKQLYNITIPESAFDYLFERGPAENGKVFSGCGHGGTWNYSSLAGYEETDEELKVTVDFYGDELYFYPVIESEYTFSKNDDGTITLQRVEKIFDRGYEPAWGSV